MNQHALRDIVDLTFWETDAQGKEFPAFMIDSLKSAAVEGSAEAVDLRGGRGNGLVTIFESQRDINITCTDALLLPELFAARMGTSLKQFSAGDKGVIRKTNNLVAAKQSGSGVFSIAIDGVPKTPADMLAYITINGTRKALTYTATAVTATDAGKFSYDAASKSIKVANSELTADAKVTVYFEMEIVLVSKSLSLMTNSLTKHTVLLVITSLVSFLVRKRSTLLLNLKSHVRNSTLLSTWRSLQMAIQ